jgi:small subunit ribosomal protein S1
MSSEKDQSFVEDVATPAEASPAAETSDQNPAKSEVEPSRLIVAGGPAHGENSEPRGDSPAEADEAAAPEADPQAIPDFLQSLEATPPVVQGEIVEGTVLKVTDEEVFVDLGLKSEAAVPRAEFLTVEGELKVQPGDSVPIWVERFDEESGALSVSYRKAVAEKTWEEVERSFHEETAIRARVVGRIKGGLAVEIGVHAFLPGSLADVRPHPDLDGLVGREIDCRVIKLNRKRGNVVVSRRHVLEEELKRHKAALIEKLTEGAELDGRVKNLTDYGAFVDLGGMDGLLHVTDMAWGRLNHPSEKVQVGQEIRVKVLKFDPEKERISLGLKQLSPDPWECVTDSFHPGDRVSGRVVSLTDYGAFIELAAGIEGLIHISEMSWAKRLRHPSKILNVNDQVEVAVLDVNTSQRRISLSLRRTLPDPWAGLTERFGAGSIVRGRVRHFTDFGAFVEIEEGVDGLIHVSNMSWTKNVKHPSEMLQKGQEIEAVVLDVDSEKRRIALGLKQLQPDVWESFFGKTHVGDMIRGKVTRKTSFGVFVELEEGIEGLCHASEFSDGNARKEPAAPKVGTELEFRVIRLNPEEKKIGLSLRPAGQDSSSMLAEKAKEPRGLSRMAEALSSAGITAASVARSPETAETERSSR